MIQTIEQATQTRILIGQNGILVVTGKHDEGIALAFKAIKLVEEEAHTSNLTQKVKDLLNVSEEVTQTETNNSSVNNEQYVNNSNTDNNSHDMENDHSSNITTTKSPKEVQPN
jgi:exosome complex component RRP4